MKRLMLVLAIGAGALLAGSGPAVAAPPPCDPFGPATFRGQVPTPKQVIGIDLGERDVTTAESDAYVAAVDAASPRVVSGTLAKSVQGRDLRYAIVGDPNRMTTSGLARVRASAAQLMDPSTRPRDAAAIARRDPAILWIAGNVHGGEESGTDASLRVLWELADRSDCAAQQILDEALVVLLPTQNPDGREARHPPQRLRLRHEPRLVRAHAAGDRRQGRDAPALPAGAVHRRARDGRQQRLLLPAQRRPDLPRDDRPGGQLDQRPLRRGERRTVFDARGIPYFNYDVYDLFYQGYGDTVPATGFGAAGMTYEKSSGDAASQRVLAAVPHAVELAHARPRATSGRSSSGWHDGWVEAERQGRAGELEPNEVVQPENDGPAAGARHQVRHYFIRADDPAKARETQALVRRLQRMDVQVRRLTKPLPVGDYTPYGRAARYEVLPAGTYVVEMEQRQKHWVQAMLNEDTYVPFPYFYDVTAWSQPLLFDVDGRLLGARGSPTCARPRWRAQADPGVPDAPADAPADRALLDVAAVHARDRVRGLAALPARPLGARVPDVSAEDIKAGALDDADVARARRLRHRRPGLPRGSVRPRRPRARGPGRDPRPGSRTAAATSAGSTARCSPPASASPRRRSRARRRAGSRRRAR